jgi:hypothetical protein
VPAQQQGGSPHGHGSAGEAGFALPQSGNLADFKVVGTVQRRASTAEVSAPAWVESEQGVRAVLFKEDLVGLSPGERAWFFRAASPSTAIAVRLTAEPPEAWDQSTARLLFRLEAGAPPLGPGEMGWVKLAARTREALVIPTAALLYSPEGPYLLAVTGPGPTFSQRKIEIGRISQGFAVVLSGLRDGERIAVGSAFSLDAERRIQAGRATTAGLSP